jgi:probable rRNA maturation factor
MSRINFFYEEIPEFRIDNRTVKIIIRKIIEDCNYKTGEINIIFSNDNYIVEINKKYLNHDYYTDIITFNYCELAIISGDLFISCERVKENSLLFSVEFKNEINRVLFHGILHLVGFNDGSEEEKKIMRTRENYYLDLFNTAQNNVAGI